jgi:hypothetical protein
MMGERIFFKAVIPTKMLEFMACVEEHVISPLKLGVGASYFTPREHHNSPPLPLRIA